MLDWIAGYVARWTGRITADVQSAIQWGLHALAGVVYTVFGNVGRAWAEMFSALDWLGRQTLGFVTEIVAWVRQIVTVDIPWLWHSLLGYVQYLESLAVRLWNDAVARIAAATRYLESLVQAAIQWVITNVYDPLIAEAKRIYDDLLKWGYWSYQLLNDPGRLAALLLDWLIAAAEAAFFRIAPPLGRFLLGVLVHQAPKLVTLLEDIFTAVL